MALDGPHPTLRALEGDNGIALYCRRDPGCNLGTGVQSLDIWTHTDTTSFPAPMVAHESTIQTPLGGSLHACSANAFKPSSRPPSPLANRQWPCEVPGPLHLAAGPSRRGPPPHFSHRRSKTSVEVRGGVQLGVLPASSMFPLLGSLPPRTATEGGLPARFPRAGGKIRPRGEAFACGPAPGVRGQPGQKAAGPAR